MRHWLNVLLVTTRWSMALQYACTSIPYDSNLRMTGLARANVGIKTVRSGIVGNSPIGSRQVVQGKRYEYYGLKHFSMHGHRTSLAYDRACKNDHIRSASLVQVGKSILTSFQPSQFEPFLFLRNPHLQTILGVFLRRNRSCAHIRLSPRNGSIHEFHEAMKVLPMVLQTVSSGLLEYFQTKLLEKKSHSFWDERERIDTPDGDFFHVDYKWNADFPKAQKSRHMVILLHGLESSSDSPLRLDMAEAFCHQGFDVAFINFRGCSGVPNDKLGSYHAGFTDDLLLFMTIMIQRWDQDGISLYLSGFSLGANVVMKCLGDLGTEAISKFNIRGAAVTGCPFDLKVQYLRLVDDPFNRMVYTRTLLRSMKEKAQYLLYKHSQGDENTKLFDYKKCRDAQTIVDIEEGLIVPVFGFHDKFDYYNKTASISVLKNIVVPTLVINAKDDPFLDPDYFPWDQDYNHGGQAPIKMVRTEFGGHVGYMFNIWAHETNIPCSSWVSSELARFAKHVQVSHYAYDVTSYLGR